MPAEAAIMYLQTPGVTVPLHSPLFHPLARFPSELGMEVCFISFSNPKVQLEK